MGETPRKKTTKKSGAKKPARKKASARKATGGVPADAPAPPGDRWIDRHLWDVQPVRDVLVVVGVIGLFWLGQEISIVTVPLLLAMLFAYLLEPVVRLLMTRTQLQRRGAVSAILVATVAFIVVPAAIGATFGVIQGVGLVGRLANDASLVYESVEANRKAAEARPEVETPELPDEAQGAAGQPGDGSGAEPGSDAAGDQTTAGMTPDSGEESGAQDAPDEAVRAYEQLRAEANRKRALVEEEAGNAWLWLHDRLVETEEAGTLDAMFRVTRNWLESNAALLATSAAATGASVLQTTLAFLGRAFAIFFMIFLTAFFFFFMATGWPKVQLFVAKLIPDKNRAMVNDLGVKFDIVINAFIRGRLTIAFLQSIVFTTGYFIIGVPAAFILGPIVAVLSIVPYLASIGIPISILLLSFENQTGIQGTWWYVLGAPTAFYFLAQALDDYVWTPLIQGKSTGMSTPAILFASIAGGVLFGVFGLLIAIPLAACIKILLDEIFWPHFKDWTEGKTKDLLPFGRE